MIGSFFIIQAHVWLRVLCPDMSLVQSPYSETCPPLSVPVFLAAPLCQVKAKISQK